MSMYPLFPPGPRGLVRMASQQAHPNDERSALLIHGIISEYGTTHVESIPRPVRVPIPDLSELDQSLSIGRQLEANGVLPVSDSTRALLSSLRDPRSLLPWRQILVIALFSAIQPVVSELVVPLMSTLRSPTAYLLPWACYRGSAFFRRQYLCGDDRPLLNSVFLCFLPTGFFDKWEDYTRSFNVNR